MDNELLSVEEDYHVMLKAMDALGHAESLAIRQRDGDGLSEVIPSLSELNSKANVLGVQLHEGENLHAHPADHPPPSRDQTFAPESQSSFPGSLVSLDDPPSNLVSNNHNTAMFISLRQWLETQQSCLRSLPPVGHKDADSRRLLMINRTSGWLSALATTERSAWERQKLLAGLYGLSAEQDAPLSMPKVYRTDNLFTLRDAMQPFILLGLLMMSALHTLCGTSRPATNLILVTLRVVLTGAFMACNGHSVHSHTAHNPRSRDSLSDFQQKVLDSIPRDIHTTLSHLKVETEFIRYATCPSCFSTYAPSPSNISDPYPHHCQYQETDQPRCDAQLVREEQRAATQAGEPSEMVYRPLKPYPYRSLISWIAILLSKAPLEHLVQAAWEASLSQALPWTDIMHAPAFRHFHGPDGKLFSSQSGGAVHLVFGLFVDWLNPRGNKQAGKSCSVGAVYLVCYNLPPDIQFKPENICLIGVISGPSEPSLHQVNHFLRPLVDKLLVLWHSGVYVSQTALHKSGHLVRGAVIPLICDLPALRKTAGFTGHSPKCFCSCCLLKRSEINNLDPEDAATEAERCIIVEEHGIRWSELLCLPYWDPTRYAVIDTMHNLFLGELRHHCINVWGIDVKDKSAFATRARPHTPEEQKKWLNRVTDALRKRSIPAVTQAWKGYVVTIAQLNGITPASKLTKREYAKALIEWTAQHLDDELLIPPVLAEDTNDFHLAKGPYDISKYRVLTADVLSQLRRDIERTFLPSWLERPPKNFGSPAHGKLKADHWRTVCTIHMVITLVRLWGREAAPERKRLLLENFCHLVIAVNQATRCSMTPEWAHIFDHHMEKYLRSL
ncbi:hypothetical protein ACG7TL_002531 [Trametes sanguinea]